MDDGCGPGQGSGGPYFYAFGASWTADTSGGYNGCYMKTPNTATGNYQFTPNAEWAEWYLPFSSDYNHTFDVWTNIDTYICDALPALVGIGHYHRWRYGHSGGISSHPTWDQADYCDGYWKRLETGKMCGTNAALWDQVGWTGDPTNSYFVFTDVVLFNPSGSHSC